MDILIICNIWADEQTIQASFDLSLPKQADCLRVEQQKQPFDIASWHTPVGKFCLLIWTDDGSN